MLVFGGGDGCMNADDSERPALGATSVVNNFNERHVCVCVKFNQILRHCGS